MDTVSNLGDTESEAIITPGETPVRPISVLLHQRPPDPSPKLSGLTCTVQFLYIRRVTPIRIHHSRLGNPIVHWSNLGGRTNGKLGTLAPRSTRGSKVRDILKLAREEIK